MTSENLYYNCYIYKLPNSLKHLKFGWAFNQYITEWPQSLISLTVNKQYSKYINLTSLPAGCELEICN